MEEQEQLADELATLTGKNWYLEHTGGGCTALVLQADPKTWAHYFMVTHCEDASVPKANEPHHLGEYINEDQDINHYYFRNRKELLAHLNGENNQ